MRAKLFILALSIYFVPAATRAGVVVNEIFYNAPDDLEDLQWIEFFNHGESPVDLSGWTLDGGRIFVFPAATTIGAQSYLVVALNPDRFAEFYKAQAIGPFKRPLKRSGERIELADAAGRQIDNVRYKDDDPWPASPDGYTASLERICPSAPGDVAGNWAASPLSTEDTKPNGTPAGKNASYSSTLPPVIKVVSAMPDDLAPGRSLTVEAEVKGVNLKAVSLLFRTVKDGVDGEETALSMKKDGATGRFQAAIPGQDAGTLVRYRIQAVADNGVRRVHPAEHDLRPTFSLYIHDKWATARIALGLIIHNAKNRPGTADSGSPRRNFRGMGGRGPRPNFGGFNRGGAREPRPPRGSSAFVYVSPDTGRTTLFDHINIIARNNDRGYKLLFHKDRSLNEMKAVNLIFEGSEWSLLAEALSYDLYRRAGNPAPAAEFVRLWVDGRMVGYHLAVERVNKSFLRRNGIARNGHLYKMQWTGRGIVGQHEKRTRTHEGHEGLLALNGKLEGASGDGLWQVIRDHFNINEVATYFAVNTVLSHWDGFFNNYFPYHNTESGKWTMYPWDQDKTWGYYDGLPDDQVFFDMPLNYGMEGARPPGARGGGGRGFGFGGRGARWWRAGGYFSRPLLANPQFRKVFLARTREILENFYTEAIYFPQMDAMAERLKEDVRLRAEASGRTAEEGLQELARNVDLLKTHLVKRRAFLLDQEELGGTRKAEPLATGESPQPRVSRRAPAQAPKLPPGVVILVPAGSRWKYLDSGAFPGPDWIKGNFKDAGWHEGPAQLGYGDGDKKTRLNDGRDGYPTYYFRKRFEVKDPGKLKPLILRLIRDDGAVVYINGQEVLRDNMPAGTVNHDTFAANTAFAESAFNLHDVAPKLLVAGSNIIAVEVHQASAESSDVSFDLELREKVPEVDNASPRPVDRRFGFGDR